jgi:hypothetical protein
MPHDPWSGYWTDWVDAGHTVSNYTVGTATTIVIPYGATITTTGSTTNLAQGWLDTQTRWIGYENWPSNPRLREGPRPQRMDAEAMARAEETWQRETAEREQRRTAARTRARSLLVAHLDESNRHMLAQRGHIEVDGSDGRRYRIHDRHTVGNVLRLGGDGAPESRWCAHPNAELPQEDHMLAQMLALMTDAEGFLRLANRHTLWI